MNKKFSTLVASVLLAGGTFSVMAQTAAEEWVTVDASQLVNGQTYKIVSGDSILVEGKTSTATNGTKLAYAEAGPVFQKNSASVKKNEWVLTKTKAGFTLKETSGTNSIYSYNNELYTNVANTPVEFVLNEDGTLSVVGVKDAYVMQWNKAGLAVKGTAESANKFEFQVKKSSVADADIVKGSAVLEEIEGAVYVMDSEGNYVGVSKKTALRATVSNALQAVDAAAFTALTDEEQRAFVWVAEGEALRSAYAVSDVYLTANATTGILTTATSPVSLSIENGILSVNGVGAANVSILSSTILPPYENAALNPADTDASKVVLFATDGKAINYDGEAVDYDPADATETIWTLKKVETSKGVYELRLVNGEGKYLELNNAYVTVEGATLDADGTTLPEDGQIVLVAGDKYVAVVNGELAAVAYHNATIFGLGQTETAYLSGSDLLVRYRDYFKMAITYDKDGDDETDLTGIFEGELIPVSNASYNSGIFKYWAADTEREFMLINSDEKILVINTSADANISSAVQNHVYRLELVTPKEYYLDQADKKYYKSNFKFEFEAGKTGDDIETAKAVYIDGHKLGAYKDGQDFILVAADQEVTLKPILIEINPKQNMVDAKKWLTKPAYYTVEVINKDKESTVNYGKVLGLSENGGIQYVSASKTDITKPEGQFAISYVEKYPINWYYDNNGDRVITATAPRYVFVNRETGAESGFYVPSNLYATSDANVFVYRNDTLAIKPVTDFTSADGFRRLTADELNENTFTIAMNLLDESSLYVTENHADKHRLGLDREAATEWRIEQPTFKMLDRVDDLIKVAADTVTIATPITYWKDNGWQTTAKYKADGSYNKKYYVPATELKVVTYILKNTANGEYFYGKNVSEEAGNAYYVCDDSKKQATRIALKEVGENTLNLIPAYSNQYDWYNWYEGQSMREDDYVRGYDNSLYLSDWQIIGGTTSATGVLKDVYRFNATTNDLFVIAPTAAPTYKKLAVGDKIVISRAANTDEVVYEKGEFAGINNIKAYEKINPALYVDTAYVDREGNYKYQYLLGVNITSVDSTEQCNNPAHAGLHTAYTEGRFLVNMADSAAAEFEKDVHTNKYVYDGETKLAFVNALHQNDSLYILDAAGKIESKSEVGNAAEHYAKFAFRMLNEADNEFVIETLLDKGGKYTWYGNSWIEEPTKGYLRWHNGNLVVTEHLEEAEHFTLEATDATPTANEEVAAAEVSVIAQNGAIIVKGAAGKVVTVANILGQTIANQVAASDNVTIAAPAGVAVVTVDGEATKVIVK